MQGTDSLTFRAMDYVRRQGKQGFLRRECTLMVLDRSKKPCLTLSAGKRRARG